MVALFAISTLNRSRIQWDKLIHFVASAVPVLTILIADACAL